MRFLLLPLALCVSGCGGCVEDGSDQPQQQQGPAEPGRLTRPVGAAKVLPRYAHLPSSALRDAGDE